MPEETLARVMRLARLDGFMILLFAGGYAAMAALAKHGTGLAIGVGVMTAGAIELHGVELLKGHRISGLRWLVASQFYLLAVILAYATWRWFYVDLALMRSALTPDLRQAIGELGWREDDFLLLVNRITYGVFALVSVAYQGGMALYYWRRRDAVRLALDEAGGGEGA